jgi:hypothetical protein
MIIKYKKNIYRIGTLPECQESLFLHKGNDTVINKGQDSRGLKNCMELIFNNLNDFTVLFTDAQAAQLFCIEA